MRAGAKESSAVGECVWNTEAFFKAMFVAVAVKGSASLFRSLKMSARGTPFYHPILGLFPTNDIEAINQYSVNA